MWGECVQVAGREFAAFPDGAVQGRFITYPKVLDFIHLFELASMNPRLLRLRGKHACIQRREKERERKNAYSHTCTDCFFSACFHRLKCETRHTRSAAKWYSNDKGMVSLLEKTTATKRQRHAVTAEQDAESIQSKGQRLAEARDTHANSAAWDCCNYDNIVSKEICLVKKLNWGSSVKALAVDVSDMLSSDDVSENNLVPLGISFSSSFCF